MRNLLPIFIAGGVLLLGGGFYMAMSSGDSNSSYNLSKNNGMVFPSYGSKQSSYMPDQGRNDPRYQAVTDGGGRKTKRNKCKNRKSKKNKENKVKIN
jgi:hypothetical protein